MYLTDQQLADLGLTADDRQILNDAAAVYEYISENPWVRPGQLSQWAEGALGDGAPDRANAAIALLIKGERIVDVGQAPPGFPS
jgi:hypothetical protein